VPGFLSSLLQCVVATQLELSLRQAAAIQFKNLCLREWSPESEGDRDGGGAAGGRQGDASKGAQTQKLSDGDKAVVRANMLEALVQAPALLQSQLAVALRYVVEADYPEAWPELLPSVLASLQSQELNRVTGGLVVLRVLCRKYEYKEASLRPLLHSLCDAALPSMQAITARLLAPVSAAGGVVAGSSDEVVRTVPLLLKLVLKSLWSCIYMDVPPCLHGEDTFHSWMGVLAGIIALPLAGEAQPGDVEDRHQWPWWKTKKWAFRICNRLFQRHSNPKEHKHPGHKEFAQRFKHRYSPSLVQAYLQQLAHLAPGAGGFMSDRCVNLALSLLQTALGRKDTAGLVLSAGPVVVYQVAFPLLCFSAADAELWAEDPQEYIRKGYDIMEDMYSPRTAAMSFLATLVRKHPDQMPPFLSYLVSILHRCAPGTPPECRPHAELDGALFALGALSETLKRQPPWSGQLEAMLMQHVLPEFSNPRGHLRAKACWVAGMYADIAFADARNFENLMQHVIQCLADPELPVRVDAVVSLRCFVEATDDVAPLRSILHALLNALFGLMAEVENDDMIFTVEAIVEKFGEEMAPYALGLITNLVHQFWRSLGGGGGDGDDDGDDDAGALACLGCVRTMATVLDAVSGQAAALYPQLEPLLQPLCLRMLSAEGLDVYEEVLEILSYMTYYSPRISDWCWALFPVLIRNVNDFGVDYFGETLTPLDNMISRDTERFLSGCDPATSQPFPQAVLGLCSHVLGNADMDDDDCVCAPQLLAIVLQHCRGRIDNLLEPMLVMTASRLEGAHPATDPFLRDVLLMVWANALFYNAQLAVQAAVRSGTLGPLLRAWHVALQRRGKAQAGNKRKHFKREQDKKVCVLGLSSLIAIPAGGAPPEVEASHAVLVTAALELLHELRAQRDARLKAEAEGGEEEEEDIDDESDDFVEDEDDEEEGEGQLAGGRAGGQEGGYSDNDDADSDWSGFTEEEDGAVGPLDDVDPWCLLADTLQHVSQSVPQRWASLQMGLAFPAQALLRELPAYAQQRRQEIAAERAEKQLKEAQQQNGKTG